MTSNAKNYLIACLACSTLVGAGIAYHQRQLLAEAKAAPTLKITQANYTSAAAQPLTEKLPAAPLPNDEEAAVPEAFASPDETRPGAGPGRGGQGSQWAARMTELMKDPEFVAAMKIEQESRIESRFGALFKQLKLTPEKLAALKTLMAERETAGREVWASAMAKGLNPRENRDELRKLTSDLQNEIDGTIRTTVGEAAYNEIEAYKASQPQRSTVRDLNQKLTVAGQPLNDSQSQQLTRILAETGTTSGRNSLITDQTISIAKGVLMPAQVEQLEKLQSEQQAARLIQEKTGGAGRPQR